MDMTPAWYGKLPALGDFASRRLPPAFLADWDAWLQRGMAYSQQHLGSEWLDTYLTSNVWRFILAPGTLDSSTWAGIVLPSVDRVGRYFPLTICAALADFSFEPNTIAALEERMGQLSKRQHVPDSMPTPASRASKRCLPIARRRLPRPHRRHCCAPRWVERRLLMH